MIGASSPPALIDEALPVYDVVERHAIEVQRPPAHVYAVLREADLLPPGAARALLVIRGLPARLTTRDRAEPRPARLTLDALVKGGFVLLGERPPRELVLGAVGRFWRASGNLRRIEAGEFRGFAELGYAKAAWNFALADGPGGSTRLSTETRVHCLDGASRRRFRMYWLVVRPFSGLLRRRMLRAIKAAAERRAHA